VLRAVGLTDGAGVAGPATDALSEGAPVGAPPNDLARAGGGAERGGSWVHRGAGSGPTASPRNHARTVRQNGPRPTDAPDDTTGSRAPRHLQALSRRRGPDSTIPISACTLAGCIDARQGHRPMSTSFAAIWARPLASSLRYTRRSVCFTVSRATSHARPRAEAQSRRCCALRRPAVPPEARRSSGSGPLRPRPRGRLTATWSSIAPTFALEAGACPSQLVGVRGDHGGV
jgi:hypothetical protein